MKLVTIRPGLKLREDAAASWVRMEAEHGGPLDVNRSTDAWDVQMQKYRDYLAYKAGGPVAPLALHPSKSEHVWRGTDASTDKDDTGGIAVDTDDDAWIRAHGGAHGWEFNVPSERWHTEYRAHNDQHRADPGALGGTTDMPAYHIVHTGADNDGGHYIGAPGHWHRLTPDELQFMSAWGVLKDFPDVSTNGNWAALIRLRDIFSPVDMTDEAAIARQVIASIDVATLAAQIAEYGIGQAVIDALAQRLTS